MWLILTEHPILIFYENRAFGYMCGRMMGVLKSLNKYNKITKGKNFALGFEK